MNVLPVMVGVVKTVTILSVVIIVVVILVIIYLVMERHVMVSTNINYY